MKRSTVTKSALATAGAASLVLLTPLMASAHVTVTPSDTAAGSYAVLTFATGHGCDGSATTALTIDIPDSVESVTPAITAGWTATKESDEATAGNEADHDSAPHTDRVVYTADEPLADGFRQTFDVQIAIPADAEGETLTFPVLQTCEKGSTDWAEVPADGEDADSLDAPAPSFVVTEATASGGHGHSDDDAAAETETAEHSDGEHAESATATAASSSSSDDVIARVFGIGAFAVAVIALLVAVTGRRRRTAVADPTVTKES